MYSLEQLLAPPPLSALLSLILISGLDGLGLFFLRASGLLAFNDHDTARNSETLRWQAVVIGAMLVAAVMFPLVLLGVANRSLMRAIAAMLLLAGIVQLFWTLRDGAGLMTRLREWLAQDRWTHSAILVLLLGMFLLALGPVTNADALDYHIGAAIAMLNNNGMPGHDEWFHSRFAGNGEVLNALGLSVGAEQFGALLQFASLTGIVGLMLPALGRPPTQGATGNRLIVLAALSSPVLLFLVSAPKPQLWPIAMTTLGFALMAHPSVDLLDKHALWKRFALVSALCMSASQAKFNFLLGGGIVGVLALYTMLRRRQLLAAVPIGAALASLIMLPPLLWKAHTYSATLLESLLSPLPGHLPGTDRMIAFARNNPDFASPFPFPLSIVLPSSAGSITTVLGIGWILFFWCKIKPEARSRAAAATVLLAIATTAIAAPPSARMYLEPYFWGLFLCSLYAGASTLKVPAPIRWGIWLQACGFGLACWFGALTLFPGALSDTWRTQVMQRSANGFSLMRWADQVLPADAVLLNGHRSMALAPRRAFDYSWTNYVDPASEEAAGYLSSLKAAGVNYVLLPDRSLAQLPLSGCFGRVFAGPGPGRMVSRNPLNQGAPYDAWILEFHSDQLPGCAQHPMTATAVPVAADPLPGSTQSGLTDKAEPKP